MTASHFLKSEISFVDFRAKVNASVAEKEIPGLAFGTRQENRITLLDSQNMLHRYCLLPEDCDALPEAQNMPKKSLLSEDRVLLLNVVVVPNENV